MKHLLLIIMLVLCAWQVHATITVDRSEVILGELVHITIQPALPGQSLIILTPNGTYRFVGDLSENSAYKPIHTGLHTIRVIDSNQVVDTTSFTAYDASTPVSVAPQEQSFGVSATQLQTGTPLLIYAPVEDVVEISVVHNGTRRRYFDSARPITFLPDIEGNYQVTLLYRNGSTETISVIATGHSPFGNQTLPPQSPVQLPNNQTSAPPDTVIIEGDMLQQQVTTEMMENLSLAEGNYTFTVRLAEGNSVRFENTVYTEGMTLPVETIDPSMLDGNIVPNTVHAIAVDPTALQFSFASYTFTAVGTALYKCVEYNYTTQTCFGSQSKLMELIPGNTYTIALDSQDPLFSQTGYLTNANFDSDTSAWTTLSEGPNAVTFAWTASDSPQSGVAQMSIAGANRNGFGNYYQPFNLTIPSGTSLMVINFSALWRVSTFNSQAGTVFLWIQDATRTTTLCQFNSSYSAATAWQQSNITTGVGGCNLASFSVNTNYTVRLRCNLNTGAGGGSTEVCRWDNVTVRVWYNDTTAPVIRNITDSPDPVNYSNAVNITVNVTDNVGISHVLVEINGTNHTMSLSTGNIYYNDSFSTARPLGVYRYIIFVNDTNNNTVRNNSASLNFTIRDVLAPNISLMTPPNNHYTPNTSFTAFYNVSDQIGVNNCTLNVSGVNRNSTLSNPNGTVLNLTATLPTDGIYTWNITCNDTSGNRNISETRTITRDTIAPTVFLNTSNNTFSSSTNIVFYYTPSDTNLGSCSLWGNWSGSWALNQTNSTPTNNALNNFSVTLTHGTYGWNVQCQDIVSNAFNGTNFTYTVDTVIPNWSGISIYVPNNSVYASGASYQFNITATDNGSSINSTVFEINFTGNFVNTTTTRSGNVFSVVFTDRAAGSYAYRWYINDSAGNLNTTPIFSYIIQKATPSLQLLLNSSYANMSVGLNSHINATGQLITPTGSVTLYLDGTAINTGSYVSNITQLTEERRYNFTLVYTATQNYSEGQLSLFADVIDTTPPQIVLGNPANNSIELSEVLFFFTPYDNIDIENCTVVLDGVLNNTKDVAKGVESNITISGIPDGVHNWTMNCSDTSNNTAINSTLKYFTVDTQQPTAFDLYRPVSGNISANISPVFIWNQTSDTTFDRYTIQIDNDVGFGSINQQANTTPVTNTSRQFTLTDQTIWYWRVIAYDMAGNQRISTQTFNYTADATAPVVTQSSPSNGYYSNSTLVNLSYTASDFTTLVNCSLYLNNTLNQTNSTIGTGTNWFIVTLAERHYNWSIRCFDIAGNQGDSGNRLIVVDVTFPASFILTGPADNTLSNNATPVYSWNPTTDVNFANYTIEVSDFANFSRINHTFSTAPISNTSVQQTPALSDGTWYWRVTAYDLAGNNYTAHPNYTVDTTPPYPFDLLAPVNNTQQRNDTPLFIWENSSDVHFKNYTLLISDNPSFPHINYTAGTVNVNHTNISFSVRQNVTWYWKVTAWDEVNLSRNSTNTFIYIADFTQPNVTQVSPSNSSNITTSSLVNFRFNVTDVGNIENCSLYINNTFNKLLNSPLKDTTQTISSNLANGFYNWSIQCTDTAGNIGTSATFGITISVQVPEQVLYESSPGATTPTSPASINLSYINDSTESQTSATIAAGALATLVVGRYNITGRGMLVFDNAPVNFSGVFSAERTNEFYITWMLRRINSSGEFSLCQSGNNNTGGTIIPVTTKATYRSNCTIPTQLLIQPGENISLIVNVFKSAGPTRDVVHYWEGVSFDSQVRISGYKLGIANVSFVNVSDPAPSEGASYVEQCNVSCLNGTCLNTDVYLQLWNGTAWKNVSSVGNITLNGSQVNPESLGNLNQTTTVNFSLYGSLHSFNNSLRCYAISTYSDATSNTKNVSVIDRLPPSVSLNSPQNNAAFEPQNITFSYTASDIRLVNCTLWGNWSGSWAANQTNSSPVSGQSSSFEPIFLDYGLYKWNVQCYDNASNGAFAATNFTINLAGDLEITSANITFSDSNPIEGQEVTIFANVTNNGNRTENSVVVQFWRGHPNSGTKINGDKTVRLGPLKANLTNVTWTAEIGTHNIFVVVDPPNGSGSIVEFNENNNIESTTIFISMWQIYYGNVTGQFLLGISSNNTFSNWTIGNNTGNIFVTDTDTTGGINWLALKALGRNTTGSTNANTINDFEEADNLLNTSNFSDSINNTYTSGGSPFGTANFFIYETNVQAVPVANSSANFTTGILWDSDDSSNSYYDESDSEDIVFVTRIKDRVLSLNGIADYEMHIPSRLKDYKDSTASVALYYEIQ